MRQNETNKRNYIIVGLCAILLVMAVGFAAFSTSLNINTSSQISSNWNIEITNITPIIPSGSKATDNSSSCDESGTPKQCGDKLTASVSANLVSPGDSIMYRIEVTNKGSLNAVLSSINLNAGSSNDIGYYVNKDKTNTTISESGYRLLEENGVLNASGDSTNLDKGYVYLTIYYKEYEGQITPSGANKTVSATANFNFVQTNNTASSGGGSISCSGSSIGIGTIEDGLYIVANDNGDWYSPALMYFGEEIPSATLIRNTPNFARADWDLIYNGDNQYNDVYYTIVKLNGNNQISEAYVGFVITDELAAANEGLRAGTYYLKNGNDETTYNDNLNTIKTAFGCSTYTNYCTIDEEYNDIQCSADYDTSGYKSIYLEISSSSDRVLAGYGAGDYPYCGILDDSIQCYQ